MSECGWGKGLTELKGWGMDESGKGHGMLGMGLGGMGILC